MKLCLLVLACCLVALSPCNSETLVNAEERLRANPFDLEAYVMKAHAYCDLGLYNDALKTYFQGLAVNPDLIDVQFGKVLDPWMPEEIMRVGTFSLPPEKELRASDNLSGKTLLVYYKKGNGDTIQFSRYLKPLIENENPAKILLIPQRHLVQLLRDSCNSECIEIVDPDSDLSTLTYDFHAHLLSIPHYVGASLEDIPLKKGYLWVAPAQGYDQLLAPKEVKVGIIWQGDPTHIHDKDRSTTLKTLSVLRNIPGLRCFSLQTFAGSEQLDNPNNGWGNEIVNLGKYCKSFADVGSFMQHMDLIITVDTAGAHLAAALGRPSIILIPKNPDLRWVGKGPTNPWSDRSLLLRQARAGDWDELMVRLETTVRDLMHSPL